MSENPEGSISLPTGKTPEYFIKWVKAFINNWDDSQLTRLREENGLDIQKKPDFSSLCFIQMDDFFPINPNHQNSFHHYVMNYYLKDFGINPKKAHLIDFTNTSFPNSQMLDSIFSNNIVDLTLRYRDSTSKVEEIQKATIQIVDQWCTEYEDAIRDIGGIGFFLGGIGPDGHIAFNVRGSDHHSTTRLMETNFETQAASAVDLGGIEISRNRLVITIGLETITMGKNTVAIIMASGEAKGKIIQESLETEPSIEYPASSLQKLAKARFYLTEGAACKLYDVRMHKLQRENWSDEKTERSVINLCSMLSRFGSKLEMGDLINDPEASLIPNLGEKTVPIVIDSIKKKIELGIKLYDNQNFFHTGPHHDDITLGYLPFITHLVRSPYNRHHFCTLTSGFTSVTNSYLMKVLVDTNNFIDKNLIQMIEYENFFSAGYKLKWDKDVFHYLDRVASNNREGCKRGLSHRIIRSITDIYSVKSKNELIKTIKDLIVYLKSCYEGEKNKSDVQQLKGMIREFEEDLVWSHYGIMTKDISHLRLGFYKGDIFTDEPKKHRDVLPLLEKLREIKPTIITLALDPEGSGPDTHYKVLQVIAEAVKLWGYEQDISNLRIWGYRNVWYRFDAAEADIIVPVSLNSMAVTRDTFLTCYLSQKDASFPSYELDGPFCELVQKFWVDQFQSLEMILGRDYWYQNKNPRLRAAHGALYLKEMKPEGFLTIARSLQESIEGKSNSITVK